MAANKSSKNLEMMIAAASLVGFLGGWILLGHAPKPGTAVQTTPITTSAASNGTALRPSQLPASSGLFQLPGQSSAATPRLRTGGS